jgi:hypothetical protein
MHRGIDFTSVWDSIGGIHTILPRKIPLFGVLLMVVENAVSGAAPESPISVQMG